jgi:hypothetical protein
MCVCVLLYSLILYICTFHIIFMSSSFYCYALSAASRLHPLLANLSRDWVRVNKEAVEVSHNNES